MVRELADDDIPIAVACRVLKVSRSGYHDWLGRPASAREQENTELTKIIREIHVKSRGSHGSPRVHAELTLGSGVVVAYHTTEMLMQREGIRGLPGNPRRSRPVQQVPTPADMVDRDFHRDAPNTLWVTDITEHPTREGKVYCCVVLDVYSRRVVGWSIDSTQTSALVTNALGMAIHNRQRRHSALGMRTPVEYEMLYPTRQPA
ncbi:IS3 family transposase [Streptosporangium vulgare]|uniref:IS3 family transposase n=1 Tax=Streptosporangium vulgare TaxID=46190 RepID=UPI0031E14144